MPVSKEHAVKIAREFLETRMPEGAVRFGVPLSVRREETRKGSSGHWSIVFDHDEPPEVVSSPGEVIVHVDEETGQPEIFLTP
jgi:hypothetical protein